MTSFSDSSTAIVLITPVIVMAAGQLAGGLAWLTISGEDAAHLVATAPLPPSRVIRAKIEVVLVAIGAVFAPLVAVLAFVAPLQAAVTAAGILLGAALSTAIQLWFRVQARRSQFRRRQTSSRLATFAEAFSSIGWAATAALVLAVPAAAVVSGLMTLGDRRRNLEARPEAGLRSYLISLDSKGNFTLHLTATGTRAMSTLTVTAKGQVTLRKDVLEHLGIRPGQKVAVEKLPDGRIQVRAAGPTGKISDAFGYLKAKRKGPSLSIEDMNGIIARGWAGKL